MAGFPCISAIKMMKMSKFLHQLLQIIPERVRLFGFDIDATTNNHWVTTPSRHFPICQKFLGGQTLKFLYHQSSSLCWALPKDDLQVSLDEVRRSIVQRVKCFSDVKITDEDICSSCQEEWWHHHDHSMFSFCHDKVISQGYSISNKESKILSNKTIWFNVIIFSFQSQIMSNSSMFLHFPTSVPWHRRH